MIRDDDGGFARGEQGVHAGLHPGNPSRALWKYLFKKDFLLTWEKRDDDLKTA